MTAAAQPGAAGEVLDRIVGERRVVICCGSGGVGKTTAAAVLALEGARRGRRAVVVTIDPARRLANALGVAELTDVATEIERGRWDLDADARAGGALSALMLDAKSTFDRLVERYAETPEQAERILVNTFYRNVSGALGGTQEYMAMERLHELHDDPRYDLVVVDTPPSRHALDFLDAPNRLIRLLDNRIFRLLMMPTRAYLRVASLAVQTFLRTVARVVGTAVIDDVVAFFRAFEGMEEGFRQRADAVRTLLADPQTSFVLVTSPRRDALEETTYFAEQLADHGRAVEALVVNRVHPTFGEEDSAGLRATARVLRAEGAPPAAVALAALYDNLADLRDLATREREHLEGVGERVGAGTVAFVPHLSHDVHDFEALREVGRALFG